MCQGGDDPLQGLCEEFDSLTLHQISAPYFVAGILTKDDVCVEAAPIIKWMVGKHLSYLRTYCRRKKWKIIRV